MLSKQRQNVLAAAGNLSIFFTVTLGPGKFCENGFPKIF